MTERKMVSFSRAALDRFKEAKARAEKDGEEQFEFEGNAYLVAYAKYLIEYLEERMPR